MSLTPELLGALRLFLVAVGGIAVGKGWVTADNLTIIVGAVITLAPSVWAMLAKRSTSKEAQIIAGRVEVNPNTQPIIPPAAIDKIVEEKKL
jgi:hypothetical protein